LVPHLIKVIDTDEGQLETAEEEKVCMHVFEFSLHPLKKLPTRLLLMGR